MTPRAEPLRAHDRRPDPPPVLRLSELLGLEVVTVEGVRLGLVRDVRLRRSRPFTGPPHLVTEGVLVGRRPHDVRWGYERHPRQGPLVVAVLARRAHRRDRYLPWSHVEGMDLAHRILTVRTQIDASS